MSVAQGQSCENNATDPCAHPYDRDDSSCVPVPPELHPDGEQSNSFPQSYLTEDCGIGTTWCADYVALVPNGTVTQPELVVLLPGLDMEPVQLEHLAYIAAYAGHRTLVVPWDTTNAENDGMPTTYAGGTCADTCPSTYRGEILTGVDDPLTGDEGSLTVYDTSGSVVQANGASVVIDVGHEAQYFSSVRQRIARGLNDLEAEDTAGWDWGQYCEPDDVWGTRIAWDSVIVGGFSAGASMAMYIGTRKETAGVFLADGLGDFCEADYDGVSGEPAGWMSERSETPLSRWRLAMHTASNFLNQPYVPKVNGFSESYVELGLLDSGGGGSVPLEDTGDTGHFDWSGARVMSTHHEDTGDPSFNAHGAMGNDGQMWGVGLAPPPITEGTSTHQLYLFDAYLSAICDL